MIPPKIPDNELLRLEALRGYSILDTLPEKEFEDMTFLASEICQTPVSLITLLDEKRQWFKSRIGIQATYTPKEFAFCAHVINEESNLMIIPDSRLDARFHDNPLVTSDPHVIFYAGVPLINPEGFALGTICVIDHTPRQLNETQIRALKSLSNQVMHLFELRKKTMLLETRNFELTAQNKGLQSFATIAAHDIKSPLSTIRSVSQILKDTLDKDSDEKSYALIEIIQGSSKMLNSLIDGILEYSRQSHLLSNQRELVHVNELIKEVVILTNPGNAQCLINIKDPIFVYSNKTALRQIFINLIANAIKHNSNSNPVVHIAALDQRKEVQFRIEDNGPGISERNKLKIFNLFEVLRPENGKENSNSGVGLATVKSLVEGLGGNIEIEKSKLGGAAFVWSIPK